MREKSPPITASLGFGIVKSAKPTRSGERLRGTGRKPKLLLVEGDAAVRRSLMMRLEAADYDVVAVETAQEGLDSCVRSRPNLVIADLQLDRSNGLDLLKELKSRWPEMTVIVLAAHIAVAQAMQATHMGAFSYLVKPVGKAELMDHVKRAVAVSTFKLAERDWRGDIAARNKLMDDRLALANKAAHGDSSVLLTGENGTGKELLGRAIHAASPRRQQPFVTVSCRTAIEAWLECELFGGEILDANGTPTHLPGAFESARGGTLLVDEIGNLPARLQVKFAAALDGEVRLICTTSCDLRKLVEIGQLQKGLYEKVTSLVMDTPPLGRRREDIPLLISHFLEQATEAGQDAKIYTPKAIEQLATEGWPESVRQLFDLVKRNVTLTQAAGAAQPSLPTFDEAREQFSRDYLAENLRLTEGNVSKSARLAKRNRTDFYKLLARYRLRPDDFKTASL